MRTSVLIGSAYLPEQSIVSGGVGFDIQAGQWYPTHDSVLGALQSGLVSLGMASALVRLCQDGLIRISSSGLAFSLTWPAAIREMLGFTGNLSGASSYTATYPSGLIFVPGYPATRPVAEGLPGYDVEDAQVQIDRSGTLVQSTHYNTQIWDSLSWGSLPLSKITTTDISSATANGTWRRFRRLVLVRNQPFHFHEIVEMDGSSDPVSLPTRLGTYKVRSIPRDDLDRRIPNSNNLWGISIDTIRIGS